MNKIRPLNNALTLVAVLFAGCAAPTSQIPATQPVPAATRTTADPDAPSPQDLAQEAKLNQHVLLLTYNATPLNQVFDDLSTKTEANITVDWPALNTAGIGKDAPATSKLRDIKLSKVLQLVFKSVEGEDDDHKLTYYVANGQIVVTSRPAIKRLRVTRVYDISFLFVGSTPTTNLVDSADRVSSIENCVTGNIDTTTWIDNGGDVGEVIFDEKRGALIVNQTPRTQWKVRNFLDNLRSDPKSVELVRDHNLDINTIEKYQNTSP